MFRSLDFLLVFTFILQTSSARLGNAMDSRHERAPDKNNENSRKIHRETLTMELFRRINVTEETDDDNKTEFSPSEKNNYDNCVLMFEDKNQGIYACDGSRNFLVIRSEKRRQLRENLAQRFGSNPTLKNVINRIKGLWGHLSRKLKESTRTKRGRTLDDDVEEPVSQNDPQQTTKPEEKEVEESGSQIDSQKPTEPEDKEVEETEKTEVTLAIIEAESSTAKAVVEDEKVDDKIEGNGKEEAASTTESEVSDSHVSPEGDTVDKEETTLGHEDHDEHEEDEKVEPTTRPDAVHEPVEQDGEEEDNKKDEDGAETHGDKGKDEEEEKEDEGGTETHDEKGEDEEKDENGAETHEEKGEDEEEREKGETHDEKDEGDEGEEKDEGEAESHEDKEEEDEEEEKDEAEGETIGDEDKDAEDEKTEQEDEDEETVEMPDEPDDADDDDEESDGEGHKEEKPDAGEEDSDESLDDDGDVDEDDEDEEPESEDSEDTDDTEKTEESVIEATDLESESGFLSIISPQSVWNFFAELKDLIVETGDYLLSLIFRNMKHSLRKYRIDDKFEKQVNAVASSRKVDSKKALRILVDKINEQFGRSYELELVKFLKTLRDEYRP